jgi:type I restriction enzyme M protein
VFPFIKTLGGAGGSFAAQMENAEFKINKPSLLIEACRAIDAMQISAQNQDVQGDLYEYLLGISRRAERHLARAHHPDEVNRAIRAQAAHLDPAGPGSRQRAALETHTDSRDITYDEEGYPHGLTGSKLTKEEYEFSQTKALTGFDSDSGMTMLRIGSMNLMLHGIAAPNFRYTRYSFQGVRRRAGLRGCLANPPSRAPSTRRM